MSYCLDDFKLRSADRNVACTNPRYNESRCLSLHIPDHLIIEGNLDMLDNGTYNWEIVKEIK